MDEDIIPTVADRQEPSSDLISSDTKLILYRLDRLEESRRAADDANRQLYSELKALFQGGLDKQELRVGTIEVRVSALETWRARIEGGTKDTSGSDKLIQVIFIILGLLGTALAVIQSGVLNK